MVGCVEHMGEVGHILGSGLWVLKYAAEHVRQPSGLPPPCAGRFVGQLAYLESRVPESVRASSHVHYCLFISLKMSILV